MHLVNLIYSLKKFFPKHTYIYQKIRYEYCRYMIKNHYISFLKYQFKRNLNYDLNLADPHSFNEKLQWLKCYYRDPLMQKCADKLAVRDYVKKVIGEKYLIPVYKIYNSAYEIDSNLLPSSFVLKPTHSSGRVIICKDKNKINFNKERKKLKRWLEEDYYYQNGEWVYKDIDAKILCEKLLDENINDYKIYCFHGTPKFLLVCTDRANDVKMNYYDTNFKELEFCWSSAKSKKYIPKPEKLDLMIDLAKMLSKPFPHVRVDFFCVHNNVFFSELTFFDANGMGKFDPPEWDYKIGKWLDLKKCNTTFVKIF